VEALDTKFHDEFAQAELLPWYDSVTGRLVGQVRSAGSDGNVTFVRVYDAGYVI
jgi:cathepsin A (carboxypeptidase C)